MPSPADIQDARYGHPQYAGQRMTKTDFLRWESDDHYVYEFNNGLLEPTTGMRQEEIRLLKRLTRRFAQTSAYAQGAELIAEVNVWLTETQMRRPDVAYYTAEQLRQIEMGVSVVPTFVIELASETDNELTRILKLHEYFEAGVQLVWWIYPAYEEVYVYTSPKTVVICTDADVLPTAPALPEWQLTVADLFGRA